ncbi:MAG: hypothetical protein ABJN62_18730 [Halioglobus sp.]
MAQPPQSKLGTFDELLALAQSRYGGSEHYWRRVCTVSEMTQYRSFIGSQYQYDMEAFLDAAWEYGKRHDKAQAQKAKRKAAK